jgi:hypothetical protein
MRGREGIMQTQEGRNGRPRSGQGKLLSYATGFFAWAIACLLAPSSLHAQGCAMCYNSASAARAGAKQALANGTLILLIPPMVFFSVIGVVVYMYRNRFRDVSAVGSGCSVEAASDDPIFAEDDLKLAAELRMLDEEHALLVGDHELATREIPSTGYRP